MDGQLTEKLIQVMSMTAYYFSRIQGDTLSTEIDVDVRGVPMTARSFERSESDTYFSNSVKKHPSFEIQGMDIDDLLGGQRKPKTPLANPLNIEHVDGIAIGGVSLRHLLSLHLSGDIGEISEKFVKKFTDERSRT